MRSRFPSTAPLAVLIIPAVGNLVIDSIITGVVEVTTGPATFITLAAAILLVCVSISRLPRLPLTYGAGLQHLVGLARQDHLRLGLVHLREKGPEVWQDLRG